MQSIRNMMLSATEAVNQLSKQLGYLLTVEETIANVETVLSTFEHCCFVAVFKSTVAGWIHGFIALGIESHPFVENWQTGRGRGLPWVREVR